MRTLMNKIRAFGSDKSGAVTVDWVALTAAITVIGIALVYAVFGQDNQTGFSGLASQSSTEADTLGTQLDGITASRVTPSIGGS